MVFLDGLNGRDRLSQEQLKAIACAAMLIDHIGAVLIYDVWFRVIGRAAFPIFCFLIAEGSRHTRSPGRYALRMLIGAIVSELPFDLVFFGGWTWQHQNVMITLLLGFLALECAKRTKKTWLKLIFAIPFVMLGELFRGDYGGLGVLMVAAFGLLRELENWKPAGAVILLAICGMMRSGRMLLFGIPVSIQIFGVLAMIPLCLYSGEKRSDSKGLQRFFYAFYPAHMLLLWILTKIV